MAGPRAALTTGLAAVLLAAPVRADEPEDADLARARAQLDASDSLAARASLAAALAAGRSGPAEVAEIYRLSGQVAGALGQPAAAEDFFRRLLALAPRATLPPGTSPKMARPFAAARAWAKDHEPLRVKVETAAAPPALTLVVLSDPHGIVASARATVRVAGRPEATVEGAAPQDPPTPPPPPPPVRGAPRARAPPPPLSPPLRRRRRRRGRLRGGR